MATNTPNLNIPKPEGNEYFNREAFNNILDAIDKNAASKEDVSNIDLSKLATKDEVNTVNSALTSHKKENATEHQRLAIEDLRLRNLNNNLQREVAYLKLKQEANERIEGGTTFADDMNGNRFGITFDAENSQNIVIRDGSMLMTEVISTEHSVDDSTVVGQSYNITGNGGRKLVHLSNGWLVALMKIIPSTTGVYLYVSKDNGSTWSVLCSLNTSTNVNDACLVSFGTKLYISVAAGGYLYNYVIEAITQTNISVSGTPLPSGSTRTGVSSIINNLGTEIHLAWTDKNQNSFNIYYAKGTINSDYSVTWSAIEKVTKFDEPGKNINNPCILLDKNGVVGITATSNYSSGNYVFFVTKAFTTKDFDAYYIDENWGSKVIYSGGPYVQSMPFAIFVPQSINGLSSGRIWVAWHGYALGYTNYLSVFYTFSDDSGITWNAVIPLFYGSDNKYQNISISVNKSNEIFFAFEKDENINIWKKPPLTSLVNMLTVTGGSLPSLLCDSTLNFKSPLFIYKGTSKVGFYGTWTTEVETPTTTATAVYDLPSTDYVGSFVKKEGNVNIDAYINDVAMDKSLENDEYMFTKDLPLEAPIKLRLELSRDNISGGSNDKVTRILGGRA